MHPSRAEEEAVWRHRARVVADLTLTHTTSKKDQTDESDRQLLRPIQLLQEFAEASLSDRRQRPSSCRTVHPTGATLLTNAQKQKLGLEVLQFEEVSWRLLSSKPILESCEEGLRGLVGSANSPHGFGQHPSLKDGTVEAKGEQQCSIKSPC